MTRITVMAGWGLGLAILLAATGAAAQANAPHADGNAAAPAVAAHPATPAPSPAHTIPADVAPPNLRDFAPTPAGHPLATATRRSGASATVGTPDALGEGAGAMPAPEGSAGTYWWLAGAAAVVALLSIIAGIVLLLRERRAAVAVDDDAVSVPQEDESPPATVRRSEPAVLPLSTGTARLSIALRPLRAGMNLLSATADCEIVIANIGDGPAEDVRLDLRLISAHTGQDADLAEIYAAPIDKPIAAPFTLAPGEDRRLTAMAVLPRPSLHTLVAAGRPMFVPIAAVNATYRSNDADRQTAQAFAIGIERLDSPKLAPFWLDQPPRMQDSVAARPHAALLER